MAGALRSMRSFRVRLALLPTTSVAVKRTGTTPSGSALVSLKANADCGQRDLRSPVQLPVHVYWPVQPGASGESSASVLSPRPESLARPWKERNVLQDGSERPLSSVSVGGGSSAMKHELEPRKLVKSVWLPA